MVRGPRTAAALRLSDTAEENDSVGAPGVGGGGEGREAYRVVREPSRLREDGGGREAYGVAENPWGG